MSERLDPELTRLESSLRCLGPPAASLNREQLMFEAGQASATASSKRRWQLAAGILATSNVLLIALLAATPSFTASSNAAPTVANSENRLERSATNDGPPTGIALLADAAIDGAQAILNERSTTQLGANQHSMQNILKSMSDPHPAKSQHEAARESYFAEPPPTSRELLEELCPRSQAIPVRRSTNATWQTLFFDGEIL